MAALASEGGEDRVGARLPERKMQKGRQRKRGAPMRFISHSEKTHKDVGPLVYLSLHPLRVTHCSQYSE